MRVQPNDRKRKQTHCSNMRTVLAIFRLSGRSPIRAQVRILLTVHSLLRNFRLADLVTIMNGICGSFSLFASARYLVSNDKAELYTALTYPLAGLLFDFFDGKVARWRKSASLLGQELDSLADLVRRLPLHLTWTAHSFCPLVSHRSHSASHLPCSRSSSVYAPRSMPSVSPASFAAALHASHASTRRWR